MELTSQCLVTDRNYWLSRGTKNIVKLADEMLTLVNEFAPDYEFK